MKTKLEGIANVTVIVMALVVGGVVLARYSSFYGTPRGIAAGDHLAKLAGLDWTQHRRSLLLVLNTGCHYCQESVPFYQKLAQAQRPGGDAPDLIAVFPNNAETVSQFAGQGDLSIRRVPGVRLESLRVNATPTLLLVDSDGRVERTWVGVLTSREEFELLTLVSGKTNQQKIDHGG